MLLALWVAFGLMVYLGSVISSTCEGIVMPWVWFGTLDAPTQTAWAQVYAVILVALVGPFVFWQAQARKAKFMAPVISGLLSEIEDWYRYNQAIEWGAVTSGGKGEDIIADVARKKLFTVDSLREHLQHIEVFSQEFSGPYVACFEAGNALARELRHIEYFNLGLEPKEIFHKIRDAMQAYGQAAGEARACLKEY